MIFIVLPEIYTIYIYVVLSENNFLYSSLKIIYMNLVLHNRIMQPVEVFRFTLNIYMNIMYNRPMKCTPNYVIDTLNI